MYVSTATFEASTDTSGDDQREGSQEVLERCNDGEDICVAQKRVLRSRQEKTHQLQSGPKQMTNIKVEKELLNSDPVDHSLLSADSNKGAETFVKQAESLKAAIQQVSTKYRQQQGQSCQQNCKQLQKPPVSQHPGQQGQQPRRTTPLDPPLYQQGQRYGNGGQYQQVRQEAGDSSLTQLSAQLQSVLDFSRLPSLEEALSPSGSPPLPPSPPPLPLFSRCPFTNQLWGLQEAQGRVPLHPLPLPSRDLYGPSLSIRRPWPSVNLPSPPAASSKPSLDGILCTSLVALTNKHREGKYWFKSGCPTPDPRWPAVQQLMAGPIPGDCDYSELRTAFLSHGQTCHLFIQNNQAWLERNQEKFGSRQVKFGYVVFTEAETAERLFRQGGVVVRRASGERIQVRVKRMDGLPAQFYRS